MPVYDRMNVPDSVGRGGHDHRIMIITPPDTPDPDQLTQRVPEPKFGAVDTRFAPPLVFKGQLMGDQWHTSVVDGSALAVISWRGPVGR
jgi:hypothetical protein